MQSSWIQIIQTGGQLYSDRHLQSFIWFHEQGEAILLLFYFINENVTLISLKFQDVFSSLEIFVEFSNLFWVPFN